MINPTLSAVAFALQCTFYEHEQSCGDLHLLFQGSPVQVGPLSTSPGMDAGENPRLFFVGLRWFFGARVHECQSVSHSDVVQAGTPARVCSVNFYGCSIKTYRREGCGKLGLFNSFFSLQ